MLSHILLTIAFCMFGIVFFQSQVMANIVIKDSKLSSSNTDLVDIQLGPETEQVTKLHFFPGMKSYINGRYKNASKDLEFFIRYPAQTVRNPFHTELHSSAHYMLGMIYFYHASGKGRLIRARQHFEYSIKWNPRNYKSYIELAHLFSSIELKDHAASVLHRLLELQLPEDVERRAKNILAQIQVQK